jgi:hypothetical protein
LPSSGFAAAAGVCAEAVRLSARGEYVHDIRRSPYRMGPTLNRWVVRTMLLMGVASRLSANQFT